MVHPNTTTAILSDSPRLHRIDDNPLSSMSSTVSSTCAESINRFTTTFTQLSRCFWTHMLEVFSRPLPLPLILGLSSLAAILFGAFVALTGLMVSITSLIGASFALWGVGVIIGLIVFSLIKTPAESIEDVPPDAHMMSSPLCIHDNVAYSRRERAETYVNEVARRYSQVSIRKSFSMPCLHV